LCEKRYSQIRPRQPVLLNRPDDLPPVFNAGGIFHYSRYTPQPTAVIKAVERSTTKEWAQSALRV